MASWNKAEELRRDALGKAIVKSDRLNERERKVRRDFWAKLKALGRYVPFVEDLIAAYYCALDPATPTRVRAMLLAALTYFILPFDFIPDMLPVIGFADDAALLAATIALVSSHITPPIVPQRHARSTKSFRRARDTSSPTQNASEPRSNALKSFRERRLSEAISQAAKRTSLNA